MIIVGVSSGVSLKTIDVAVCEVSGQPPALRADVFGSLSIPWPSDLKTMVNGLRDADAITLDDYCLVDVAVGEAFAAASLEGMTDSGYYPEQIDLIGIQAPILRHDVLSGGRIASSLHIGQSAIVADWTGVTTIGDFRRRDLAAGGQGGPLMGYVDWLLNRDAQRYRAVQYIDTIASTVFLPPLRDKTSQPVAFETGPGTVLIDYAESQLRKMQISPDKQDCVSQEFLAELMAHPYFERTPPKTLNQRELSKAVRSELWQAGLNMGLSPLCVYETFLAYAANTIADAFKRFAPVALEDVILCGSGMDKPRFVAQLYERLAAYNLMTCEDLGIAPKSKASLGTAVLAYEAWHNRPCSMPSLTGVRQAVPLGMVLPGANYERLLKATFALMA